MSDTEYDWEQVDRIVSYVSLRLSTRGVNHDPQPQWLWFSHEHVSDVEKVRGWSDIRDADAVAWCPDVIVDLCSPLDWANGNKTPGTVEYFLDIICDLISYQRIAFNDGDVTDHVEWAEDKVYDRDPVRAITMFRVVQGLDPSPDENELTGTDTWIDGVDLDLTLDIEDLM